MAERRTIFAMRGSRGPDDSPYMLITYSTPPLAHGVLDGVSPSHRKSGNDAFTSNLVWLPTSVAKEKERNRSATLAGDEAV
eukprot:6470307-Amphidinium_carterae.1